MIMEYISRTGFSLKAFICVYVCLVTCVNLGLSLTCDGYICGHGTKSSCNSENRCSCSDQFSHGRRRVLFGKYVQYCLQKCYDNPCPSKYFCRTYVFQTTIFKRCVCSNGYGRSADGTCVDVNECFYRSPCAQDTNSQCINTIGSYRCKCNTGYNKSARSMRCKDVNECTDRSPCAHDTHSRCINTIGSYRCKCNTGYNKSGSSITCKEIDECLDTKKCDDKQNKFCVNTPGFFRCDCLAGYNRQDNNECKDIDECLDKTNCDDKQNTLCINTPGSFQCDCIQGYNRSTDNNECKDIDECLHDGICNDKNNTVCVNTQGSFNCECLPGYTLDNTTPCQDIDECTERPCGEHSVCENVPGNYSCRCQDGYTLTMDLNSTCVISGKSGAELTGANGGSSVGLYVGVGVGVLVLLGLVVAAIVIRRRRNSKKPCEGTVQFSSGDSDHNQKSSNGYNNVSLDNGDVDLPTETRKEKTVSVEYSNAKIPVNKLARNSSSISVEYSNNKILASTKRNEKKAVSSKRTAGVPEEQGVYSKEDIIPHTNRPETMTKSPNPVIVVKSDDTDAYNTLDACTLSTTCKSQTKHQNTEVPGESESHVYSNPYEEHVFPKDSRNTENMAIFPNLVTGETFDDTEAYNTLDAFNLNTQSKQKIETRTEDQDPYNIIL